MQQLKEIITAFQLSGLAKDINPETLERILSEKPYRLSHIKRGDIFALSGDTINELQIVIEGELHAEMIGKSGKQILIDHLDKGRILAPALLFSSNNKLPISLKAMEDTSVFSIQRLDFKEIMLENPILFDNYLRIISDIVAFLTQKIRQLSLQSLQGKIGHYFLQMQKKNNSSTFTIIDSWKDIAEYFGVSRQSLARSLSSLESEGLIAIEGKTITLLEPQRLAILE